MAMPPIIFKFTKKILSALRMPPKFRIVEVISYLCGCMTLKYTFEFYETNMGLPCGSCPDNLVKFLSCSQIG